MVNKTLTVGAGLLSAPGTTPCQLTAMFHRDGRHFLKQLANALGFGAGAYTISARPGSSTNCGEVVLRAGRLLVVLRRDSSAATLTYCTVKTGISVPPEDFKAVNVSVLRQPRAQLALIARCRELSQSLSLEPPDAAAAAAG